MCDITQPLGRQAETHTDILVLFIHNREHGSITRHSEWSAGVSLCVKVKYKRKMFVGLYLDHQQWPLQHTLYQVVRYHTCHILYRIWLITNVYNLQVCFSGIILCNLRNTHIKAFLFHATFLLTIE